MADREEHRPPAKAGEPMTAERRDEERRPVDGRVLVRIPETCLPGPSRDISRQGLYFLTDRPLKVEVVFEDGTVVGGELVRLGVVREGETGIAVRFADPLPERLLPRD